MASMTATVRVRAHGRSARSVVDEMYAHTAQAAYDYARGVSASARRRAPVRTGFLRSSIRRERLSYGSHRVVVGANYAGFVEYGTRHMAAQPFFRPALEEHKAIFRAKLKKSLS